MTKSNYALLTALYDSQNADFYKDIYFPIIKYGLFILYNKQVESTKYYDTTNIQDVIIENFGIKIPLTVLKQSLRIIHDSHSDFEIGLFHKGDQLLIKKVWDVSVSETIDRVYEKNLKYFNELQKLFTQYVEAVQVQADVTFIDFFSNNTEDIYHYINNDANSELIVNENYVHVVNFLKWIKNKDENLYDIAADIFWGSIISAFLQREIDFNIKPQAKVRYYLDSSLVLALLDLDSLANNLYCRELVSMINASGHLPYVHSLTIREIDSILHSVERDGAPKPNSGIADAYNRRDLSPSKILQIRQRLNDLIVERGVSIEECTNAQLDEIQSSYKLKSEVQLLASMRTSTYSSSIRDIHDVYMYDFIRGKNRRNVSIEKSNAFFVTLNTDLIKFYKDQLTHDIYVLPIIHPARIIMDLWIHNSQTINIHRNALTEVIARCTALNQTDVRRKLRLISKYYKENEFSEENYKNVYIALMNRSKQVMLDLEVVQNPEIEDEEKSKYIENILSTARKEEEQRRNRNLEHQKALESMSIRIERVESEHKIVDIEKSKTRKLIEMSEELSLCQDKLNQLNLKIYNLEKKKGQDVSMVNYWVSMIFQLLCLVLIIVSVVRYFSNGIKSSSSLVCFIDQNLGLVISAIFTLLTFVVTGVNKLSIIRPKKSYKEYKRKLEREWYKENRIYNEMTKEQEKLIQNIEKLKLDISSMK